ncbi:MAG TPA: glycoside hydrolase family 38 C-terminal domain-containing protein [Roseiarcus sp.]|nr:glycoside hydrolase family 38 C-terminal domain-containing protein [Roseiarcus sp.]
MALTLDQRRERLRQRVAELEAWRVRARAPISGWSCDGTAIAVGAPWPALQGLRRFAARAEAPAHWPLAETRLALDLGGESLVTLNYANGQERFGLDPYHQEFALAGRAFGVEAESVARAPFGEPVRAPTLRRAEFAWIDLPVEALHRLLTQLVEAAATLADDEVVPHLLEAGEAALRALDWPSLTADYLARIAPTREMQTVWRLPPVSADPPGLDAAERASVVSAHAALRARLQALQAQYPPRGKVALTGHAHIDLAWLWPYDETRRKLRRTFHTALGLLARSPDFVFNQSTAHYYAEIERDDPALFEAIRARVAEGRWEPIGGMWVEPDTNMPTGESLVRQLLYGQRYFERTFGARSRICWLPDCFGFSPALPQLLRQADIDSFFTIKLNWSETNRFPHDLFWWEGLDGSRVLAHTFDNPLSGYNGFVRPDGTAPTWVNFRGKERHDETLLAVGYGDGGGGVTPDMIEREAQLRDFPALPAARWSRVDAFFAGAHATAAAAKLPVWSGEMYLELHRATLTTQSGVKRRHRRAERGLIAAETLAALAALIGGAPPPSLEPLWRIVLKNEFHDILPGSSIREVYEDAERELDGVVAAAAEAQQAALQALAAQAPAGDGEAVLIANPSLDARAIEANLPEGFVSTAQTIPPLGVRILRRAALQPAPGLKLAGRVLENAHLRAELGADGTIASLVHKASGREALAGRGNQLWVYAQDKPRNWDAWDIEEDYERSGEELVALESLAVAADGPHYAALRVARRWRHSRIVQEIGLAANGRRLDIRTHLDWRDRRALLRSLTPARVRARRAIAECAFGVIERPTHANTSWEAAMFEWPAHRFVDLAEPGFGLALLNDAKYGHSVRDNVLGLSLVRSPVYPDPLADEGEQRFAYALMPHAGPWRQSVRAEAEALNQPLLASPVSGVAEGLLRPLAVEGVAVALAGLKGAEDGDGLVLRVYEPAGARGAALPALAEGWTAAPVDLLERPVAAGAEIGPFEVKSWRLRRN